MKVVFACAGTGGHINPAIAMANIIKERDPKSEFLFLGTKSGLENRLVPNAGFDIKHIRTGKIERSLTLKNVKALYNAYLGMSDAKKILKNFKPDLVIGTGGYICVPTMIACKKLHIKYLLHESNSFPGISVKLFSKKAEYVMTGFKDTKKRLKRSDKVVFTGTPIKFSKEKFEELDIKKCKAEFEVPNNSKKIVLVTCGSQGAKKINETLLEMLKQYQDNNIYYILVTGEKNFIEMKELKENIEENIKISLDPYIKLEKFVYDMDKIYKIADLCVTRAGAMTINELAIANKKSILIPLPSAAENHQYYNAKALEKAGLGKVLEQKDLTPESLNDNIKEMLFYKNNDSKNIDLSEILVDNVNEKIYECIKNSLKK